MVIRKGLVSVLKPLKHGWWFHTGVVVQAEALLSGGTLIFCHSWEQNPWTSCSASCRGGTQSRSVACVEEDVHGLVSQVEEWKCLHSPRPAVQQDCNTFDCPQWTAMEWSQVGVTS